MNVCKSCERRIVLPAFSSGVCSLCGDAILCANTPADALCDGCAKRLGFCVHCGAPLNLEDLFRSKTPAGARYILNKLYQAGYEAFLVGGCVRDILMGKEPHDWDICTSAQPQQVQEVFSEERCFDAYVGGIRHPWAAALDSLGGEIRHLRRRD